jgi:hypothetical protein
MPSEPSLIRQYLSAIWADWASRMSGIAGLILLGVALVFRLTEVAQARYWIGAATVCYVIASFQAWKKERHTITNLKGEIESLRLSIEGLNQDEGATNLTPKQLVSVYEGRTTLQGERLAATRIGQRMTVSGKVQDIRENSEGLTIVFYDELRTYPLVMMAFEKRFIDPVSALSIGNEVTVRGKIVNIGPTTVSLENCELVKF